MKARSGFEANFGSSVSVAESASERSVVQRPAIEYQNASEVISLDREVVIGREPVKADGVETRAIRHRELSPVHALVLIDAKDRKWICRIASDAGLFIDGRPVTAGLLLPGTVVQLGPLAWRVDHDAERLHPVRPIAGFDLAIDAEVPGRLCPTKLAIRHGQMTAIVGPSGCGKSTLLETIRDGSGLKNDVDVRGRVYFVPQKDLVHSDLRLGDALESIGQIYGREILPYEIDEALDAVGLPIEAKHRFPSQLSGGQLRRFRIAGALLSGAGVIVLDEPDSGLDHQTADEIISLLRSLSVCGASIVAVTHHRHVLAKFDRVIEMATSDQGGCVLEAESASTQSPLVPVPDDDLTERIGGFRRLRILLRRERQKLTSPKLVWLRFGPLSLPQLVVSLLMVPMLFAIAVAISVPTDPDRDVLDGLYGAIAPMTRLGFMAVVSVIWMSASGSHLSITRDRELIDYERSHGIGDAAMLFSKSLVLAIAGVLQTLVFAVLLDLIRYRYLDLSYFVDERASQLVGVALCLVLVSIAATMLGVLISVVAGRTPLLAAAMLPVIMMVQILFSVPFAVSNPDGYEPLADYDRLTVISDDGGESVTADSEDEFAWEDEVEPEPLWLTSLISYTTLSRYGDKWLRSFAVSPEPPENASTVQWRSAETLLGLTFGCFAMAFATLKLQIKRLGRPRQLRLASASAALVGWLVFGLLICGSVGIEHAAGQDSESSNQVIAIEITDGRYDQNAIVEAFGGRAESKPRLRTLDGQDRLGLVALELVGKIKFSLNDQMLKIELVKTPKWELMRHLAPPQLVGRDEAIGKNDVVVFVHGLEGGASTFAAAQKELDAQDIAWMRFEYPNDGPPDEIGAMLAQTLEQFHDDSPRSRLHLVAHSLGGLVSLSAVTHESAPHNAIDNVFTLGTPFGGSTLASFHDELELFDVLFRLATVTRGALNTVADGQGEAAQALRPGSDFLRDLLARPRPAGVDFHVAAGTKSFLTDQRREQLSKSLPQELKRLRIDPKYAERLEKLLQADELDDGAGDGAVSIDSAMLLPNPQSRVEFPLTHLGLVSDKAPLRWVLETAGLQSTK
ncbi:ATP-binding cassette domain-containing protein [Stieleria sp. JC731]|uniref:ATP-binding cassette domain-containing protein n=1 Tax=Stieleria sp. JC731 TaxID=2894195 RepID=UPI001E63B633|nr:ATP-binding cassette domain-containing protein [Stieleria sp. JC731]MCC9599712.1 ATP-binding cassette domain-containing protein [Stieleria sp. JC731]